MNNIIIFFDINFVIFFIAGIAIIFFIKLGKIYFDKFNIEKDIKNYQNKISKIDQDISNLDLKKDVLLNEINILIKKLIKLKEFSGNNEYLNIKKFLK